MRKKLSGAERQQIWLYHFGNVFAHSCHTRWCRNEINVFSFHCGHDTPVSRGGGNSLGNVYPICSNCNLSMGVTSLRTWNKRFVVQTPSNASFYVFLFLFSAICFSLFCL